MKANYRSSIAYSVKVAVDIIDIFSNKPCSLSTAFGLAQVKSTKRSYKRSLQTRKAPIFVCKFQLGQLVLRTTVITPL